MKAKTEKGVFFEASLSKWIPHQDDNIENPGETVMRFGKLKGKKLSEVEKKDFRAFKKRYRLGGKNSEARKSEESQWLWPLLHYFEHFKARQLGADGDHEIPSVEELNERRETGVVAGMDEDEDESDGGAALGLVEDAAEGETGILASDDEKVKPAEGPQKRKNAVASEEVADESVSKKKKLKSKSKTKAEPEISSQSAEIDEPVKSKKKKSKSSKKELVEA